MELWQLRDEHKQERTEVDGKMNRVVLGVEAREEKPGKKEGKKND